jgi:hypothetical protein
MKLKLAAIIGQAVDQVYSDSRNQMKALFELL